MSTNGALLYIARRVAALGAVLVAVSILVFALEYAAPGSVVRTLLGPRAGTPQEITAIKQEYHLNDSLPQQYWIWLRAAIGLNFGRSLLTNQTVTSEIASRLPLSLELAGAAFVFALVIGILLGVIAALWRGRAVDQVVVASGVLGISTPAFATGLALLYVFGYVLHWFPTYGAGSGIGDRAWHLVLPAIALGLTEMGVLLRLTRAAMIASLQQDYIVFARARGLPRWRVIIGYALRNALIPVTTASGLVLPLLFAGAVLVEVTFSLPGVGQLLVQSITSKDVTTVQGLVILIAATVGVSNLLVDLIYLRLDPRISFGSAAR